MHRDLKPSNVIITAETPVIIDFELATLNWVWWFNEIRLHSALGYATPIEFETDHYRHNHARTDQVPGEPALHSAFLGLSRWVGRGRAS